MMNSAERCPYCGTQRRAEDIFCMHCGNRLPAAWPQQEQQQQEQPPASAESQCPFCGTKIRPIDNFCLHCGNRLPSAWPQQEQPMANEAPAAAWENPTPLESYPYTDDAQAQDAASEEGVEAARLLLYGDNGAPIQEFVLDRAEMSIGRGSQCDILLTGDRLTSRHHAVIRYEGDQYVLYDQGSVNGTFLNGHVLEQRVPYALHGGDQVRVGKHDLIFHWPIASSPSVEDMPTIDMPFDLPSLIQPNNTSAPTYRTNEEERATAYAQDHSGTWVAIPAAQPSGSLQAGPEPAPTPDSFQADPEPAPTPDAFLVEPDPAPDLSVFPLDDFLKLGKLPSKPSVQSQEAPQAVGSEQQQPAQEEKTPLEQLRFTAFYSKEVAVESWNTLLVYTHIEAALDKVIADSQRFKHEIADVPRETAAQALQLLPRGTHITMVPTCKGVAFNPRRLTFEWLEDWQRTIFRYRASKELAGSAVNGKINIFVGPLLVATIKMPLLLEGRILQPQDHYLQTTADLYKQIFASYSHNDAQIVFTCRNVYKALGFDVLIDIDSLRAGQVFSSALRQMIDNADIFQLFWSEQAAKSPYVRQEWEYALQLNRGEGFVRPVYWEIPMVQPPDELANLHFAYLPSYTFS
jgi:pSer/pThr/pTyr-binding forkhead associated (FHA) protein